MLINEFSNSAQVDVDTARDICWAEEHRTNGHLCTISRISKKRSAQAAVQESLRRSDVYTVILYLSRYDGHEMWCDERQILLASQSAGSLCIYDGMHEWRMGAEQPCECVIFQLPRAALNLNADENGAWEFDMHGEAVRIGLQDPVMHCLSQALDAICSKATLQEACLDYMLSAVIAHMVKSYGRRQPASFQEMGRLAPWQIRRTREMMAASLDGRIGVADLADACRLSPSHFTLLFKRTVGTTPHQWLLDRRIEQAKNLLRDSNGSLIDIAYATGFADQSHFTRVFSQRVSSSPLAWRRRHRADQSSKLFKSTGLAC